MRQITATFYDDKTLQKRKVRIYFDGADRVRITSMEHDHTYTIYVLTFLFAKTG